MTLRKDDPIRAAMQRIARASDPAEVVGALASALTKALSAPCTIDLTLEGLPRVHFVQHPRRDLTALMRSARGGEPIEASDLARSARDGAVVASLGKRSDPIERVRLALRAEAVTMFPLPSFDHNLGFVCVFGRRLNEDGLRWAETLTVAAAAAIEAVMLRRSFRTEVAARDAAITMLVSLYERSPIPTAFVDDRGHVVLSNHAFADAQGTTADSLFDRPLDALRLPALAELKRAIAEVRASGVAALREVESQRDALLVALHPVRTNGVIVAVALSVLDFSSRRRAETAARALADAASILGDARSDRAVREAVVAIAARWLGETVALRGASDALYHPIERADRTAALLAALPEDRSEARARATGVAHALSRDDLAILALTSEAVRVALDGPIAALFVRIGDRIMTVLRADSEFGPDDLAFATDLSRLAERAFESAAAREAAQRSSLLFADFLAMVSRDLRDPIAALTAQLFMAQHSANPKEALTGLRRHAERLRDVTQRIAEAMPGPPRDALDPLDLGEVVREAATAAIAVAEERHARVIVDAHESRSVTGDRRRLIEALRDVFNHAAYETPVGGIFCIRVEARTHEIAVSVSHNGAGFALPDARRVFDALWDGRRDAGALTMARAVLAAHGGRSWVETAPARGTAYCFALPLDEPLEAADAATMRSIS